MAGTFSCLCLERGELQMESDDNDHHGVIKLEEIDLVGGESDDGDH